MSLDIKSGVYRDFQVLSKTSQGAMAELGVKTLSLSVSCWCGKFLLLQFLHKILQLDPKVAGEITLLIIIGAAKGTQK